MRVTFTTSVRGKGIHFPRGRTEDLPDELAAEFIARGFAREYREPAVIDIPAPADGRPRWNGMAHTVVLAGEPEPSPIWVPWQKDRK